MSRGKRLGLAVIALVAAIAVGNLLFLAVSVPSWVQVSYGATMTVAILGWGLDDRRSGKESGC